VSERREFPTGPVRSRLADRAERAVASRRVFPYLAGVTALLATAAGIVAHVTDHHDFPTLEDGIWWAIVTIPTVGYGDIVPTTLWGRILGSIVIIFGVTFLSFLIAIVTSLFVDAKRAELEEARATREEETRDLLRSIDARLAAIEMRHDPPSGARRP
jgi:voltage-gated potassium channel